MFIFLGIVILLKCYFILRLIQGHGQPFSDLSGFTNRMYDITNYDQESKKNWVTLSWV